MCTKILLMLTLFSLLILSCTTKEEKLPYFQIPQMEIADTQKLQVQVVNLQKTVMYEHIQKEKIPLKISVQGTSEEVLQKKIKAITQLLDSLSFNECAIEEVEKTFNINLVTGESFQEPSPKLNKVSTPPITAKETTRKDKTTKKEAKTTKKKKETIKIFYHTVTTGDNRTAISKKHTITIEKLTSLNPKVNWKDLKTGDKIIVKIE